MQERVSPALTQVAAVLVGRGLCQGGICLLGFPSVHIQTETQVDREKPFLGWVAGCVNSVFYFVYRNPSSYVFHNMLIIEK